MPSPLGKGLSSLISAQTYETLKEGYIPSVPVHTISPNPYQPRVRMDDDKLSELSDSIKEKGILSPLVVTRKGDGYQLIAGERRLRAAKKAGLASVPVIVRELSSKEILELALVENLQREDLNALEEAMAYHQLRSEFHMNAVEIGKKLGVHRSFIVHKIRLLQLPDSIKTLLMEGKIGEKHALALLRLETEERMLQCVQVILSKHMSGDAAQEYIRRLLQDEAPKAPKIPLFIPTQKTEEIERNISRYVGVPTTLQRGKSGGKIIIKFTSEDEFNTIYSKLQLIERYTPKKE